MIWDRSKSNLESWKGVSDVSLYPGDQYDLSDFSYLPGQQLSRCTCPGEEHPGLRIATAHSWAGLHPKSRCSRQRHKDHRVPFRSPVGGRRSVSATNGSIRPKIWSSPTRPLRYRTCILGGKHIFVLIPKLEYGECVMAYGCYSYIVFSNKPLPRFPSTVSRPLGLHGGALFDHVELRQQLL